MHKACSLDFINREFFETDILDQDEKVLFKAGEKITPEIILRLYFKDIFIPENWSQEEPQLPPEIAEIPEDVLEVKPDLVYPEEKKEIDNDGYIIFDEDLAKRTSELSLKIGKLLGYNQEELDDLEQGAYYHNVGITRFKSEDLTNPEITSLQAEAGYDILLNQRKMSEEIALCAKLWAEKYDTGAYKLGTSVPYHHIVAISRFYDKLLTKKLQKDLILKIMLQCGGNRFNIFVLHKFIKMMRDTNG